MKKTTLSAAIAVAAMAFAPASAYAVTTFIDDFSDDQRVTSIAVLPEVSASQVAAAGAIGGWRDMRVETGAGGGTAATSFEVANGLLAFSNNFSATGKGWLVYDGPNDVAANGIDTDGLGGLNFLIGPNPYLDFDVVSFESDLDVLITAWDMDGSVVTYFETLPPVGLFTPILPLADFVLQSGASFDWTRVGALEFFVESKFPNYDGALDAIKLEAIPLPASALLLFAGLGGLSVIRARRRKS